MRRASMLDVEPTWQHRLLVTVNHWITRAPLTVHE